MISRARADALRKFTPRTLRAHILGSLTPNPLIVADEAWGGHAIDAEVGHLLLLPSGTVAHGDAVAPVADLEVGRLFEAKRAGLVRIGPPGNRLGRLRACRARRLCRSRRIPPFGG